MLRLIFPICLLLATFPVFSEPAGVELVIEQRQFNPSTLSLPANTQVLLTVHNRDRQPAEFESYDLSREIVIPPGASARVYVGPLKPGTYRFFDDFNPDAEGRISVGEALQEH